MISRDYLSVKVWDIKMDSTPVETFPVHEYLRSKLCSLYENDCIFDKFECVWNGTDRQVTLFFYDQYALSGSFDGETESTVVVLYLL